MIFGQLSSAVVALSIALSLHMDFLDSNPEGSWWILAIAAMCQGTIMGLMMPSRQALIPEIIGEEQLLNAISLSNVGTSVMRFLAPAIEGFLIDAFDFQAVYYTMTAMYLLSIVFLGFLHVKEKAPVQVKSATADIREGLSYLRHETTIVFVLVFSLVAATFSMPHVMLLPVFAEDILNVGASGLGLLMSVSGIRAITGSLVMASLPNKKRGLLLILGTLIMALALIVFAFSESMTLSLSIILFIGIGQTSRMTLGNNLIQYYSDHEYRGRIISIYMMEFGLTSFGSFIVGLIAEEFNIQWVVGGFTIVLVVISLAFLVFVRRLRRLE